MHVHKKVMMDFEKKKIVTLQRTSKHVLLTLMKLKGHEQSTVVRTLEAGMLDYKLSLDIVPQICFRANTSSKCCIPKYTYHNIRISLLLLIITQCRPV